MLENHSHRRSVTFCSSILTMLTTRRTLLSTTARWPSTTCWLCISSLFAWSPRISNILHNIKDMNALLQPVNEGDTISPTNQKYIQTNEYLHFLYRAWRAFYASNLYAPFPSIFMRILDMPLSTLIRRLPSFLMPRRSSWSTCMTSRCNMASPSSMRTKIRICISISIVWV